MKLCWRPVSVIPVPGDLTGLTSTCSRKARVLIHSRLLYCLARSRSDQNGINAYLGSFLTILARSGVLDKGCRKVDVQKLGCFSDFSSDSKIHKHQTLQVVCRLSKNYTLQLYGHFLPHSLEILIPYVCSPIKPSRWYIQVTVKSVSCEKHQPANTA